MMGPPESPEQESLPPAARPAQNMLSVMAEVPYSARQEAREMTGTVTFSRAEGREELLSLVVPLDPSSVSAFFFTCRRGTHDIADLSLARGSDPAEGQDGGGGTLTIRKR